MTRIARMFAFFCFVDNYFFNGGLPMTWWKEISPFGRNDNYPDVVRHPRTMKGEREID